MPIFALRGPFPLSHVSIDNQVGPNLRGIFVLGRISARGVLRKMDVLGRSDDDLAHELKRYVGTHEGFLFQSAASPAEAFHMECGLYHQIKRSDFVHPARPAGTALRCALCGAVAPASRAEPSAADRARVYRSKAEEIRTTAETMHPETTERLLRLADAYDRLAKTMETVVELEPKRPNKAG